MASIQKSTTTLRSCRQIHRHPILWAKIFPFSVYSAKNSRQVKAHDEGCLHIQRGSRALRCSRFLAVFIKISVPILSLLASHNFTHSFRKLGSGCQMAYLFTATGRIQLQVCYIQAGRTTARIQGPALRKKKRVPTLQARSQKIEFTSQLRPLTFGLPRTKSMLGGQIH